MSNKIVRVEPVDKWEIKEEKTKILCVFGNDSDLYVGINNRMVNLTRGKECAVHSKSIRTITGNGKYVVCGSYDGGGTVIEKSTNEYVESIEGIDTEIKGIGMNGENMAIATRGRSVWILRDLEISKIIDDHTQDVKGCCFYENRLYTWSYDCTINVYEVFEEDHSWEPIQSLSLSETVWTVVFFADKLCAALQSGELVVFGMKSGQWKEERSMHLSVTPILTMSVVGVYLAVICNRNAVLFLNEKFEVSAESRVPEPTVTVFSSTFFEPESCLVCSGDSSSLFKFFIEELE